jgi:hypothetical protein
MSTLKRPHAKRGWLKNGNPPGDPSQAPRCGARAKSTQRSCLAPAMTNGRCRMHGGMSTGPKTPEGLANSKFANWKTGYHSAEAKEERRQFRELIKSVRRTLG